MIKEYYPEDQPISLLTTTEKAVLWAIQDGESRPATMAEICHRTHLKNRAVTATINSLRRKGALILSTTRPPGGFWIAQSPEEATTWVKSVSQRGRSLFAAVSKARKRAVEAFPGQIDAEL